MKTKTLVLKQPFKKIFLAFGSNIGYRRKNIEKAIAELKKRGIHEIRLSSYYETSPLGPKQKQFINAAGIFKTNLTADELLKTLKDIEKILGRKKTLKWGPRNIDIDILFYSDIIIKNKNLIIPHKEIQNRLFVLYPLNEIASAFIHPVEKKQIKTLLKNALTEFSDTVKILK